MIIDTNVHLGHWPFRHLPLSTTADRVARLKSLGVTEAWAASFDFPFQRDLSGANERLAKECAAHPDLLRPVGSLNPTQSDWQEDLRRAHETLKVVALRLYPAWHGYKLDHPQFAALLADASARKLPVQIVVKLEDERTRPAFVQLAPVDLTPLVTLVAKVPDLRLQILNAPGTLPDDVLIPLARSGKTLFDFAMVEALGGVVRFADRIGIERLAFGSHFPFFVAESAHLKLKESDFTPEDLTAIRQGNVQRWRQR